MHGFNAGLPFLTSVEKVNERCNKFFDAMDKMDKPTGGNFSLAANTMLGGASAPMIVCLLWSSVIVSGIIEVVCGNLCCGFTRKSTMLCIIVTSCT